MRTSEIERRLTAIETTLADLKDARARVGKPHPVQVLEQIHGTFEDDDAFREAMRLGRRWRRSQGARGRKAKAKPG